VPDTIQSYELNFQPLPHGVTVSCKRYTVGFPVCSGTPSNVSTARRGFVHLHILCSKKKRKEQRWWQRQLYTSKEVYSGSCLLADLNFQPASGLYKNFTRISPSEFEFVINLIAEKNLEKGHSVQENHFCSRKFGTDATFLGKWWFIC